jgi:2-dehydropantoate 2-reductase
VNILVYGAGVSGVLHAWALERDNSHSVALLVRLGTEDRWAAGIDLHVLDGRGGLREEMETVYRPRIVTGFGPGDDYDLVVEAVRYTQTEPALNDIVEHLGDATLLLFNNHWAGLEIIDRWLPKDRYVLGLPRAGGVLSGGILSGAFEGGVALGASTSGRAASEAIETAARENLETVEELFRGVGFQPELVEEMEPWYWVHFASTAVWTAAAAKAGGFDHRVDDARAIHQALRAGNEAMDICRARGADVRRCRDADPFLSDPGTTTPVVQQLLQGPVARRMMAGRVTFAREFGRYYDDLIETARRLSIPTPHLDTYRTSVDC